MSARRTGGRRRPQPASFPYGTIAVLAGVCLLALLYPSPAFRAALRRVPRHLAAGSLGYSYLCWLTAWSGAAFLLCLLDKVQALRGGPRVPEKVLSKLCLAGGFPGTWAGMLSLRHKLRAPAFWAWLVAATAGHGALAWVLLR